jgi:hypothetical protein
MTTTNHNDFDTIRHELLKKSQSCPVVPAPRPDEAAIATRPAAAASRNGRALTADEYRRRPWISRQGPPSPLAVLAAREVELHAVPAAIAKLSDFNERRPDPNLRVYQLANSVDTSFASRERGKELKADAIRLYASLRSRDPLESMLDRLIVATHNAAMNCFGRAAITSNTHAQQVNLRYGTKSADTFGDLMKLRDARRGESRESITVGDVKVEAGGQAIVGKVEINDRVKESSEVRPRDNSEPED